MLTNGFDFMKAFSNKYFVVGNWIVAPGIAFISFAVSSKQLYDILFLIKCVFNFSNATSYSPFFSLLAHSKYFVPSTVPSQLESLSL